MREKVSTELFAAKRKLETIKTQRQKDAKDLSAMRHLKDKAQQVGIATASHVTPM